MAFPQIQINPITFSQIMPRFHPFPLHIHFHMDFHSTEGLYNIAVPAIVLPAVPAQAIDILFPRWQ